MSDKPLVILLALTDETVEREQLQSIASVKKFPDFTGSSDISNEDCSEVVGIVMSTVGMMDATLLDRCKKLRTVVRHGVGFDNVDTEHAGKLGVCVCNVPDYGIEEVADTALSHILGLFRQTTFLYEALRNGVCISTYQDTISGAKGSRRIRGKTLGLIGIGMIGIAVAERAKAFGFEVIFYDPFVRPGLDKAVGGLERVCSVEELVQRSDCVSLHCALTEENRHMINERVLRLFKKEAFLVNVSRGALIDECALAKALKEGWIAGAALDVHEKEPFIFKGSVFDGVPNVICTPHIAWYSPESYSDCWDGSVKAIRFSLSSSDPTGIPNCVNRQQLNIEAGRTRWSK